MPSFDEARKDVEAAWRRDQARPLARKAAEEAAETVRKEGGDLEKVAPRDRVITTEPISRLAMSFGGGPARANEISRIPDASEALREALFALEPKAVAVAADTPESTYYVLTLNVRIESNFQDLYTPFSGFLQFMERDARMKAEIDRYTAWMASLRAKAGLKPGWAPPEESERRPRRRGMPGAAG